jgi:hypothetical protein
VIPEPWAPEQLDDFHAEALLTNQVVVLARRP